MKSLFLREISHSEKYAVRQKELIIKIVSNCSNSQFNSRNTRNVLNRGTAYLLFREE